MKKETTLSAERSNLAYVKDGGIFKCQQIRDRHRPADSKCLRRADVFRSTPGETDDHAVQFSGRKRGCCRRKSRLTSYRRLRAVEFHSRQELGGQEGGPGVPLVGRAASFLVQAQSVR